MKTRILINKATGELDGVTIASVDSDIDFVQPSATHDVLDVPPDHPAIHAQTEWSVSRGEDGKRTLRRRATTIQERVKRDGP